MEKKILGKLKGGAALPWAAMTSEVVADRTNFETYICRSRTRSLVQKLDEAGVEVTGKPPAVNWVTHLMG